MSELDFKEKLQEVYLILEFDPYNTEVVDFPRKCTKARNVLAKSIRQLIENEAE